VICLCCSPCPPPSPSPVHGKKPQCACVHLLAPVFSHGLTSLFVGSCKKWVLIPPAKHARHAWWHRPFLQKSCHCLGSCHMWVLGLGTLITPPFFSRGQLEHALQLAFEPRHCHGKLLGFVGCQSISVRCACKVCFHPTHPQSQTHNHPPTHPQSGPQRHDGWPRCDDCVRKTFTNDIKLVLLHLVTWLINAGHACGKRTELCSHSRHKKQSGHEQNGRTRGVCHSTVRAQ
jgi:hypothetical protein